MKCSYDNTALGCENDVYVDENGKYKNKFELPFLIKGMDCLKSIKVEFPKSVPLCKAHISKLLDIRCFWGNEKEKSNE